MKDAVAVRLMRVSVADSFAPSPRVLSRLQFARLRQPLAKEDISTAPQLLLNYCCSAAAALLQRRRLPVARRARRTVPKPAASPAAWAVATPTVRRSVGLSSQASEAAAAAAAGL